MTGLYTTRVAADDNVGYRILCSRFGLESWAGPRLQKGLPGSGNMFVGAHKGNDRAELEKVAERLEKYLNDNEDKRGKKRKNNDRSRNNRA